MVLLNLSEMASKALRQLSSCSEEAVIHVVRGTDARFYHYLCDGQDDRVGESQGTRYHCRYITISILKRIHLTEFLGTFAPANIMYS